MELKSSSIFDGNSGFRKRKASRYSNNTPAGKIFNPDFKFDYGVDFAYHQMTQGRANLPVFGVRTEKEMMDVSNGIVRTAGRIIDILDAYVDGARLSIAPKEAHQIYTIITAHLESHLHAMNTDPMYSDPPVDELRYMAEFAAEIATLAEDYAPIDAAPDNRLSFDVGNARHERFTAEQIVRKKAPQLPSKKISDAPKKPRITKATKNMDAIERYLEMNGYV